MSQPPNRFTSSSGPVRESLITFSTFAHSALLSLPSATTNRHLHWLRDFTRGRVLCLPHFVFPSFLGPIILKVPSPQVLFPKLIPFSYTSCLSNTSGVIYLHGYKAQTCAMVGKKNTFELVPPNSKLKHFWFMADSEADKKRCVL